MPPKLRTLRWLFEAPGTGDSPGKTRRRSIRHVGQLETRPGRVGDRTSPPVSGREEASAGTAPGHAIIPAEACPLAEGRPLAPESIVPLSFPSVTFRPSVASLLWRDL